MGVGPLGHKIGQGLRFDCFLRHKRQGFPHEFGGPLGYSTRGLLVLDYLSQRERRHHGHRVGLEVVTQLASSQDYGVDQFLDVGVVRLSLGEHFADEVDRSLDG